MVVGSFGLGLLVAAGVALCLSAPESHAKSPPSAFGSDYGTPSVSRGAAELSGDTDGPEGTSVRQRREPPRYRPPRLRGRVKVHLDGGLGRDSELDLDDPY